MSVTMRLNDSRKGVELIFSDSSRPSKDTLSALRENGFRWHNQGKYWFAKQTPERMAFAQSLADRKEPSVQVAPVQEVASGEESVSPAAPVRNTFADSYYSVGSSKILNSADVSILSVREAYFREENVSFASKYGDTHIVIVDLSNAGSKGKTCRAWTLSPKDRDSSLTDVLFSENHISSCKELIDVLRSGRDLEGVQVSNKEFKGVEIFSPFNETKPLDKLPEKWTKRNFCAAFLSGQIFQGVLTQRLTDDYAMDAAYNFGSGIRLNIPVSARGFVEDWSSLACVRTGKTLKEGVCEVEYYDGYSSSKTFTFDISCDIREGKRRTEEYLEGLAQYNSVLERSVISVSPEEIDPGKIYRINTLEQDPNTDIYGVSEEAVQGFVLLERLEILGSDARFLFVEEMEIDPRGFYEVSNFTHRGEPHELETRIIECGNHQQFVTGTGLLELTSEGIYFPIVQNASGEHATFESFRDSLQKLRDGTHSYGIGGLTKERYAKALENLEQECGRAAGIPVSKHKSKLDDLISSAKSRSGKSVGTGKAKTGEIPR